MILRKYYKYLFCFSIILALFLLEGCSKSIKSEKEIIKDLQASETFISNTVEIADYEIIKRQTNKEDKTDFIYLTVRTDDPELTCELSYIMQYVLYNEGWLLESVERYLDGPWHLGNPPEEVLLADILAYDTFIGDYESRYEKLNTDNCSIIATRDEDGTTYKKQIVVEYNASDAFIDYYAEYNMEYSFYEDSWWCISAWADTSRYSPNFTPTVEEVNFFVSDRLDYDNLEFIDFETDLENRSVIANYRVTKNYGLMGSETYLTSVPLSFSLDFLTTGSGSPQWECDISNITESLIETHLNIEGTWVTHVDKGTWGDKKDISLVIRDIKDSDTPNTILVNMSYDVFYHSEGWLGNQWDIQYKSDGYVDVSITWSERGRYYFNVGIDERSQHGYFIIDMVDAEEENRQKGIIYRFGNDVSPLTKVS